MVARCERAVVLTPNVCGADTSDMAQRPEDYFVAIGETLVGRKPGGGAAEKARELRRADPFSVVRSLLFRQHTDARAWQKGANGERLVGFVLGRLPTGWHVFHDIPVGVSGANIDHVVVGPAGTFTLNTKNLTGKVWVGPRSVRHNGHPTDYLRKAVDEAGRASWFLTAAVGRHVEVRGALAILADSWTVKEKPTDVFVGGPRGVKDWLLRLPVTLSSHEVIQIAAAASKPSTWATAAKPAAIVEPQEIAGDPCSCGGQFIERRRRSDGQNFLGCSRYPQCRRTRPSPV